MILGIDATNIRTGGGLTHLKEILDNADNILDHFDKVVVWSNRKTLSVLPESTWLEKKTHSWLNKSFAYSFLYQIFKISKSAKIAECDLVFVPGGTFLGNFKNIVSMSQNMLPFEKNERKRFKDLRSQVRFRILYLTQMRTFKKSLGIIFLTNYAKNYIEENIALNVNSTIIPHGINPSFKSVPKIQKELNSYDKISSFQFLYVSIVTVYKHQDNIAKAVIKLRAEEYPISLQLVGPHTSIGLATLNKVLELDTENCVQFKGPIAYKNLKEIYKNADAFVFGSSCENMPIILLEAMTAGLPIASSNMGPMPEILGDDGFYFNPLDDHSIYITLKEMLQSKEKRSEKSKNSYNKSLNYTWKECSAQTFKYLSEIAHKNNHENTK